MNPKYPIYIPSKGRWNNGQTRKRFEEMNVPYYIVVEPQEYELYANVIDKEKILVLPFSNLKQGSIPARNWIWEHAIKEGHERHWIIDDNIIRFYRLNRNQVIRVVDGTIFKCAEEFTNRYENVALSGFNNIAFSRPNSENVAPFQLNTRIYSITLILNSIPYRWRGRYNEDTDLSIRVLKDGLCTIQFNAFLADKATTMHMKGGNTDELYQDDGRLKMAESLNKQHPHITRVTQKWNRYQHHVNYKPFRYNKLIKKKGLIIPKGINNYGMKLITIEGKENK